MTRKLLISAAALLLGISTYVPLAKIVGGSAGTLPYSDGTRMVSSAAGSDTQTIRFNGTVPTPNSVETNDGTKVTITPTSTNTALTTVGASSTSNLDVTTTLAPGTGSGGIVRLYSTGAPSGNSQNLGIIQFGSTLSSAFQNGAQIAADSRQAWSAGNAGSSLYFSLVAQGATTTTERMRIWDGGDISLNRSGSALATNATTGFTFLPNMAGLPTGTPSRAQTGSTAVVYNTTTQRIEANTSGSTWRPAGAALNIVSLSPSANSTTAIAATTDYEPVTTPATGTCTVTLPDATSRGPFIVYIRAVTGGTVNLTVARAGSDTINGGTTSITLTVGQAIMLVAVGTDWQSIGNKSSTNATIP